MWQHVCCHITKLLLENQAVNIFNNVILARNRQLPDDDRKIETCRSIFKSFNINNLSVCVGWCTDQVTLRSARCKGKDEKLFITTQQIWKKTKPYYSFVQLPKCTDFHTCIFHRRTSSIANCVSNITSKVGGCSACPPTPQTEN